MGSVGARRFVLGWVAVLVGTETVAVCVALVAAATTWDAVVAIILLEGLLLGFGQRWILSARGRGFAGEWLAATIAGTLLGRCAQFAADTSPYAATVTDWNLAAQIAMGAALGALVGALMALPQAIVMRNQIDRPLWWIAARALAWSVALPSLLLAGGALAGFSGAGPLVLSLAILLTFGVAAAFVGLIEGVVLERLRPKAPAAPRTTPAIWSPSSEIVDDPRPVERRLWKGVR